MTWRASATGAFHELVEQLRRITTVGDTIAERSGHLQIAKDAALTVADSRRAPSIVFGVELSGHSTSQDEFSVQVKVTCAAEKKGAENPGDVTTIRGDHT